MDSYKTPRRCRVEWGSANQIGVSFLKVVSYCFAANPDGRLPITKQLKPWS
jgi:hypothetical protein